MSWFAHPTAPSLKETPSPDVLGPPTHVLQVLHVPWVSIHNADRGHVVQEPGAQGRIEPSPG